MPRTTRAYLREEKPDPSLASGVRPTVPVQPDATVGESDLPPPFTPHAVDRDAGRYFESHRPGAIKDRVDVLVVEDDELLRGTIHEVLVEAGHAAVSAANLTEARVYLAVALPDVIVLDLNLAGEFGGDLLAELATLGEAPVTVIISAYPFAGLVAQRYGIELVRKPFSVEDLGAAIDRAHGEHRRPRAPRVVDTSL